MQSIGTTKITKMHEKGEHGIEFEGTRSVPGFVEFVGFVGFVGLSGILQIRNEARDLFCDGV